MLETYDHGRWFRCLYNHKSFSVPGTVSANSSIVNHVIIQIRITAVNLFDNEMNYEKNVLFNMPDIQFICIW